ncbi:hypothetical protein Godav_005342, partial [Gossypium davidsonii]|nr:hypothetical protein [Gossypium davidsonii]
MGWFRLPLKMLQQGSCKEWHWRVDYGVQQKFVQTIQHLLVNVKSWVIQHLPRECDKIAFKEIPREVLA